MKARERDGIQCSESHTGSVARQRQGEALETTSSIYMTVQVVDEARTDCRQPARPEALEYREWNMPQGDNIRSGAKRGRWKQKQLPFIKHQLYTRE